MTVLLTQYLLWIPATVLLKKLLWYTYAVSISLTLSRIESLSFVVFFKTLSTCFTPIYVKKEKKSYYLSDNIFTLSAQTPYYLLMCLKTTG